MSKPWIKTVMYTEAEQLINIQPTPEMCNYIEVCFSEIDGSEDSGILYISKDELPILIQKMQEMMEYVTKQK